MLGSFSRKNLHKHFPIFPCSALTDWSPWLQKDAHSFYLNSSNRYHIPCTANECCPTTSLSIHATSNRFSLLLCHINTSTQMGEAYVFLQSRLNFRKYFVRILLRYLTRQSEQKKNIRKKKEINKWNNRYGTHLDSIFDMCRGEYKQNRKHT